MTTPKDIESRIKRLAKFINGLSAWNLHRGEEAIQELVQDAQRQHVEIYRWLLGYTDDVPSEPGKRYAWRTELRKRLPKHIVEAVKRNPKDDKQDGGEDEIS